MAYEWCLDSGVDGIWICLTSSVAAQLPEDPEDYGEQVVNFLFDLINRNRGIVTRGLPASYIFVTEVGAKSIDVMVYAPELTALLAINWLLNQIGEEELDNLDIKWNTLTQGTIEMSGRYTHVDSYGTTDYQYPIRGQAFDSGKMNKEVLKYHLDNLLAWLHAKERTIGFTRNGGIDLDFVDYITGNRVSRHDLPLPKKKDNIKDTVSEREKYFDALDDKLPGGE